MLDQLFVERIVTKTEKYSAKIANTRQPSFLKKDVSHEQKLIFKCFRDVKQLSKIGCNRWKKVIDFYFQIQFLFSELVVMKYRKKFNSVNGPDTCSWNLKKMKWKVKLIKIFIS